MLRVKNQYNKKMGFKIKKSLLAGTSGHKKATSDQMKIQRVSDTNLDDGRAKSSAFQLVSDKDKENSNKSNTTTKWDKPTTSTAVTDNPDGTKKTTTNTNQKGTETTTTENKDLTTFKSRCAKYNKKNSAAAKADGCTWKEGVVDPKADVTTKPLEKNSSSETNTELKKPKKCTCTNPVGVVLTYKCGEAQPKACGLDKKKKCQDRPGYAEKKAKCAEGRNPGKWNEKYCSCLRDKTTLQKIGEKIGDIKLPKGKPTGCKKGSLLAQCMGSDGGKGPTIRKKNRR